MWLCSRKWRWFFSFLLRSTMKRPTTRIDTQPVLRVVSFAVTLPPFIYISLWLLQRVRCDIQHATQHATWPNQQKQQSNQFSSQHRSSVANKHQQRNTVVWTECGVAFFHRRRFDTKRTTRGTKTRRKNHINSMQHGTNQTILSPSPLSSRRRHMLEYYGDTSTPRLRHTPNDYYDTWLWLSFASRLVVVVIVVIVVVVGDAVIVVVVDAVLVVVPLSSVVYCNF